MKDSEQLNSTSKNLSDSGSCSSGIYIRSISRVSIILSNDWVKISSYSKYLLYIWSELMNFIISYKILIQKFE
jgi:hypothetical protein